MITFDFSPEQVRITADLESKAALRAAFGYGQRELMVGQSLAPTFMMYLVRGEVQHPTIRHLENGRMYHYPDNARYDFTLELARLGEVVFIRR